MIFFKYITIIAVSNVTFGGFTGRNNSEISKSETDKVFNGGVADLNGTYGQKINRYPFFNYSLINRPKYSRHNSSYYGTQAKSNSILSALLSTFYGLEDAQEIFAIIEDETISDNYTSSSVLENASKGRFSDSSQFDYDLENVTMSFSENIFNTSYDPIILENVTISKSDILSDSASSNIVSENMSTTGFNDLFSFNVTTGKQGNTTLSPSVTEKLSLTSSGNGSSLFTTVVVYDSQTLPTTSMSNLTVLETINANTHSPTTLKTDVIITPPVMVNWTGVTKIVPIDFPYVTDAPDILEYLDCGLKPSAQLSSWYRVVGGAPSQMFEWPWVISLGNKGFHSCGATLILPRFLLTAAHCVGSGRHLVAKGATESIKVKKTYIHPGFWRHHADLALVELEEPFYNLNPICLEKIAKKESNVVMFIAGWGATKEDGLMSHNQLMSAEIITLPGEICSKVYGRYFTDSMICAGMEDGSTDACHGDSGGPLMENVNGTWYLKGIISYGKGCGREDSPGVYMEAVNFRDWIAEKVRSITRKTV